MSGRAGELATVVEAMLREIRKLSDADLSRFLAGEGSFKFVPKGYHVMPPAVAPAAKLPVPVGEIRARLQAAVTEAEARAYLRGLELRLDQAKLLAGQLDVRPAHATIAGILSDIVKVYVGGRVLTRVVQRS